MRTSKTIPVILFAGLAAAHGQITTFDSKEIILRVEKDRTIPLLKIEEPRVAAGSVIVLAKATCIVRGTTSDPSGIKKPTGTWA
jgi:hypothetical protein